MQNNDRTYIIGHKNPDTDSICSAIGYAYLKHEVTGNEYVAARAGEVNDETRFVLDYFGVEAPMLIENITTQVKDIEIRKTKGVSKNMSIKNAWNMMQENEVVTIPVITDSGMLEGLITVGDIATSYMNVYDSNILSAAKTSYRNIIDTLNGKMIVGDTEGYFDAGKVLIATANPDTMEDYIDKNDIVILGNRYESQLCAIEMEAACLIVCVGATVSMTIQKLAASRGCRIIATPYDAYTTSRLVNQSIPVDYFMKRHNLTTFDEDDYIDEVREVMGTKRYRDFPVLNDDDRYVGMISRRNLLGAKGKKVILVDHNEKNQSVEGVDQAEIQEIIDHHRIGAVETYAPVFFRNQPLGCTSTIIYQMYQETDTEVPKEIAGLLCSAILSDTLMFRSPTCTSRDKKSAFELAKIADMDVESFAENMFSAGENFNDKTPEEILYQDFKRFTSNELKFGVGQVISTNKVELQDLTRRMMSYIEEERKNRGLDMMFLMMTNILTEVTGILCAGDGARQLIQTAFSDIVEEEPDETNILKLPGVLSRKKQLIPKIMALTNE